MRALLRNNIVAAALIISVLYSGTSFAGEKATIDEVYAKVVEGVQVLEQLGEQGLEAFNGNEFAWKDTFLLAVDCENKRIAATPNTPLIGASSDAISCKKTGKKLIDPACQDTSATGLWTEYYWPNRSKDGTIERRLSFTIPVKGTPWLVVGSVWDENTTAEELNASLK